MNKIIIFDRFWNRNDVLKNPNYLFVFGDNDAQIGIGGQAIIRGLPNTIGIPTKKYPTNHFKSFYTDNEYETNVTHINQAINNIITESIKYTHIVLPNTGFGTGLAQLPKRAPLTYQYLLKAVEALKNAL